MEKQVWRYYLPYRPPMLGNIPRGMINIEDYEVRKLPEKIDIECYGYADYEQELKAHDIYQYELLPDPDNPVTVLE